MQALTIYGIFSVLFEDGEYTIHAPKPEGGIATWHTQNSPTLEARRYLANEANEASRGSRVGGAPILTVDSDASTVADWLQWNDPNGVHSDTAVEAAPESEGAERYTLDYAWETLASMLFE